MTNVRDARCPSLRLVQNAASALPYDTRAAVVDRLGPVLSTYAASTESGPYANLKGRDILRHQTASCIGRPFFGSEVCLLGDDGREVAFGGRKRDIIKTGGINVPAADVEDVIARHPAVAEVACVGVPDRAWGEAICAAVVIKPAAKAETVDFTGFCAQHLSRFQVPRRFVFLPELPRNLTGKVVKDELRRLVLDRDKETGNDR